MAQKSHDLRDNLDILKVDMINDVSGEGRPLSSINYIWVTIKMMMIFSSIEDKLKAVRNPLWVQA